MNFSHLLRALGQAEERGDARFVDLKIEATQHSFDFRMRRTMTVYVQLRDEPSKDPMEVTRYIPPTIYPIEEFWKYARQVILHAQNITDDELDEQLMDFLAARIADRRSSR